MNDQERQDLILSLRPLAIKIARKLRRDLPRSVQLDDLVSEGMIGAIDAVSKFDASKRVPLKAYATWRIRGAIIDYLRDQDPHGRYARSKMKQEEHPEKWGASPVPDVEALAGGYQKQDSLLIARQQRLVLARAISCLPSRHRFIVQQCYFRERTQASVASSMGLDESRISQLHKEALLRLRRETSL